MKLINALILNPLRVSEEHQLTSWLFIKMLSLVYLVAFLSIAVQITGLVGANGILPFNEFLQHAYQQRGYQAFLYLPTLFWINSGDLALQIVAYAGCLFSVVLFFGYRKKLMLVLLFVSYLSLFHAGQMFLTFQWDTLLLEAGFLAIFLTEGPSHLIIFLYHWLLFRLRFMSGLSKLMSGDESWLNLTTLNYYFETQPLPHAGAWYFHQLPAWILQSGTAFTFFTELIVPFFIFLPRKFRIFAAVVTISMQLLIIATSNHNWINILTILLCLFLLDDRIIKKLLPASMHTMKTGDNKTQKISYVLPLFAVLIISSSVLAFVNGTARINVPQVLTQPTRLVRSWGIGHDFHIFPTMQTQRQELQIEGSYDGNDWKAYQFKYKPGALAQQPQFIVPHQPRLDWMIWFVPPQHPAFMYWFNQFITKLKLGSPEVLSLLNNNPFKEKPPEFIRVQVFQYKFTSVEERQETGNWWKYKYLGLFPYVKPRIP